MLDCVMLWLRPSRVLGLLLFGVVAVCGAFASWVIFYPEIEFLGKPPPKMDRANWLFFIGVCAAVCGWIVSSMVTIRNSIKQHTINTLLQTRLSATYMEEARNLNRRFFTHVGGKPVAQKFVAFQDPEGEDQQGVADDIKTLSYLLNYYEFVAVGIRHGDLDERVLRGTLRGIALNLRTISEDYVATLRGGNSLNDPNATSKAVMEHFLWLTQRWKR